MGERGLRWGLSQWSCAVVINKLQRAQDTIESMHGESDAMQLELAANKQSASDILEHLGALQSDIEREEEDDNRMQGAFEQAAASLDTDGKANPALNPALLAQHKLVSKVYALLKSHKDRTALSTQDERLDDHQAHLAERAQIGGQISLLRCDNKMLEQAYRMLRLALVETHVRRDPLACVRAARSLTGTEASPAPDRVSSALGVLRSFCSFKSQEAPQTPEAVRDLELQLNKLCNRLGDRADWLEKSKRGYHHVRVGEPPASASGVITHQALRQSKLGGVTLGRPATAESVDPLFSRLAPSSEIWSFRGKNEPQQGPSKKLQLLGTPPKDKLLPRRRFRPPAE